jgi:hypothetical protein
LVQKPEQCGFKPIAAQNLKVGMEVWLKVPWFKHPFAKNRFKLVQADQIETIQRLRLNNIYYHHRPTDPSNHGPAHVAKIID